MAASKIFSVSVNLDEILAEAARKAERAHPGYLVATDTPHSIEVEHIQYPSFAEPSREEVYLTIQFVGVENGGSE